MKFPTIVALFFYFFTSLLSAQTFSIKGSIANEKGEAISKANIELRKMRDSTFVTSAISNDKGEFELKEINKGIYQLNVTFIGYETHTEIVKCFKEINLVKIVLMDAIKSFKTTKIVVAAAPAKQKGDTSEFKAAAFKTNPDANAEDLVNKMPGVTNTNGKIQVQGEDVKTVLVDGKPFFGDDPNAVLKNLPADAIDKVQVFDAKSAQSQFTGFDDGNTSKTINIITKAQYKNGVFGKVYGGYGYDNKWRGGASINSFKNERKISFLFNSNNINEQNFSDDDLLGVMSATGGGGTGGPRRGGSSRGGGPQNSSDNFLTPTQGGIVTTQAFGLNYTNKWKKVEFTASYFFNYSKANSVSNLYRTYITQQSEGLIYTQNSIAVSKNMNQRFNLKLDWKIDSFNSIQIQPRVSYQDNSSRQDILGVNTQNNLTLSEVVNAYISNQNGFNISAPILFKHAFTTKGRTISINTTPGFNQNTGKNNIYSLNRFIDTFSNDTLNQLSNLNKNGYTMASNVTYTEPLSKSLQLLINYTSNINLNNSDKRTNQFNNLENGYTSFDSFLSNTFKSQYVSNSAGASLNYKKDKLSFNFGGNYQVAQLSVNRTFPIAYSNSPNAFISFLPSAMLQYRKTQQKNLRIFYRTSNNAPNIDQLQDIVNNNNPLQLSIGNSKLTQDYQNSLNVRYSTANTKKSTSYFGFIGGTVARNYIANSTFIANKDTILEGVSLSRGSQLTKPVNLQGYYNLRSFTNYSFVIKKIKSNINVNAYGSAMRTPSLINGNTNYSRTNSIGGGFSLSSNISKNLDFTISSNSSFSTISNSLQVQLNSQYLSQNSKFKIQAMPWKGLVLQTDISHQYYKGLSQSVNTNFALWNAGIGYKFLKDRQAEVRLVVFDLLKQNTSVSRNTSETYYEDVKTNILQRYFMLNFTYNIKYFKQAKLPAPSTPIAPPAP